jgi:hypothetical protein
MPPRPPASLPIHKDRDAAEEMPREETARLAGMTGPKLGDWLHRRNAEDGVEGLRDRPFRNVAD